MKQFMQKDLSCTMNLAKKIVLLRSRSFGILQQQYEIIYKDILVWLQNYRSWIIFWSIDPKSFAIETQVKLSHFLWKDN